MITKKELLVGTLTGITGNIGYAFVLGLKEQADTSCQAIKNILCAPIPLWYFIIVILLTSAVVLVMVEYRRRKSRSLPFLEVTERDYKGFTFQWVWRLNPETNKYEMEDFWPLCPHCHQQLRVELYDTVNGYHCTNGHIYNLHTTLNIKRDLIHELRREFKEYSNLIDFDKEL